MAIKSADNVGTTYVNILTENGHYQNVVNLNFATLNFTSDENGKVEPDQVTSCRLRMDIACAEQVHAALGKLLESRRNAMAIPAGLDPAPQASGEKPN